MALKLAPKRKLLTGTNQDKAPTPSIISRIETTVEEYIGAIDDTPVDGVTTRPISSNWAADHVSAADPHTGYARESVLTAQGDLYYASAASTPAALAAGTDGKVLMTGGAGANPSWEIFGSLGASVWVVPNDATAVIKTFAANLESAGYPVLVCDGTNDEVQLLASINNAGTSNESVVWLPGNFYLGALLDIPALQNYSIDARGATFLVVGDHAGIRFDSVLDSWIYLHVVGSNDVVNGITAAMVEVKPTNNAPIDLQVGFWSNRFFISGLYNKTTGYNVGSTGLLITPGSGEVHHNEISVNDAAGFERGVHIASAGANAYRSNQLSAGIIARSDVSLKVGSSGASAIKGNQYHIGRVATAASAGIETFGDDDIYEVAEVAGAPASSGVIFQSGSSRNIVVGSGLLDDAGWTDNGSGNKVLTPNTFFQASGNTFSGGANNLTFSFSTADRGIRIDNSAVRPQVNLRDLTTATGGNRYVGDIYGYGYNNAGTPELVQFALLRLKADDDTDGSEDGSFEFYAQNAGTGTTAATITGAGVLNVIGAYQVDATQVVTNQQAAVADVTDGLLATTITQLNALLARLRTHGLIAT